jgi:hypothetical protein
MLNELNISWEFNSFHFSDEYENPSDSIRFSRESDSNATDESDFQLEKYYA